MSEAFIECYNSSKNTNTPFALKVFISGRNRLEDPGAKALSEAFKVGNTLKRQIFIIYYGDLQLYLQN